MLHILASITEHWAFEDVIAHLKTRPEVQGLLLIGSFGQGNFSAASDYDLVIVLREAPQTWYVGITTIEGRMADLLFVAASAINAVQALAAPVSQDHSLVPIIRWLQSGHIIFDRNGELLGAQQNIHSRTGLEPIHDDAAYGAWFAINYNLAVAQRLANTDDQLYRRTVTIRMAVYGHADIWFGYFTIRRMVWEGDKAAVSYLREHDLRFLETYEQFITAIAPEQKLTHYIEAARQATAPLGGLWSPASTVMNIAHTEQIWQGLLRSEG